MYNIFVKRLNGIFYFYMQYSNENVPFIISRTVSIVHTDLGK